MRPSLELIEQLCAALTTANSTLPYYKQLYEALRQQILDGLLLPGMCLPSSRVLAKQLNLSRNTVSAAIDQLCAEGYAAARPKSGVYILATAPLDWQIKKNKIIANKIKKGLSVRGQQIAKQAYPLPARGAFAGGVPDLKQFPFALWHV